jgi:hypothetical protein
MLWPHGVRSAVPRTVKERWRLANGAALLVLLAESTFNSLNSWNKPLLRNERFQIRKAGKQEQSLLPILSRDVSSRPVAICPDETSGLPI